MGLLCGTPTKVAPTSVTSRSCSCGWGGGVQFLGLSTDVGLLVTSKRLLLYVISVLCLCTSPSPAPGRIRSEPVSGVLGSLRSRGWAGAKSMPPLSLLYILAGGRSKPGLGETTCGLLLQLAGCPGPGKRAVRHCRLKSAGEPSCSLTV